MQYEFINKSLFFPKQEILVIGDLHIGYDLALGESGILLPEQQVAEVLKNMKKIFDEIKTKKYNVNRVVFLGDIKHLFSCESKEKTNFNKVLDFLKTKVSEKDIILIKGNHDVTNLSLNFKDYYIKEGIAFLHGNESYPEIYNKAVECVVTGHLHPSVILEEESGIKHEIYKCFLEGEIKGRKFIVVPSFLEFYEGTPVNFYKEDFIESFSIIPKRNILDFRIHVVGKNNVYEFGKIRDLN